jgi:hypothetical protein
MMWLRPLVQHVVVCNPKHNHLLKQGSKNDRIDARKLADLLRLNALKPVYHGEHGTRVQNRLKALYNGQAIRNRGRELYHLSLLESWLKKQENAGRRMRAELLFRQMDELKALKRTDTAKQRSRSAWMASHSKDDFSLDNPFIEQIVVRGRYHNDLCSKRSAAESSAPNGAIACFSSNPLLQLEC